MTTRDDVVERLALAGAHPWGPTRSALVAEAVTWADALEDEDLAVQARLDLAVAYYQGDEEWKALAPFAWLLSRYETRSDLFDAERLETLQRNYGWAVPIAADNPAVPAARLRDLDAGLEEFYRRQGASMHTVHAQRYHADLMLGLDEAAAAELAAWRATPRDELSECEGCDPQRQVEWATMHEDWETAVAAAVPVLSEEIGCGTQPQSMQSVALLALLASGRPRAAWDAHVRSWRVLRSFPQVLDYVAYHMEYLALSGRPERGLKVLRQSAHKTADAESARILMAYLACASLVAREAVRAGYGDQPLGVEVSGRSVWSPGPGIAATTPLSQAQGLLADWARAIAARYDRRNANTGVSQRLERRLARQPITSQAERSSRDALACAGVELLEPGEALPEAIYIGAGEEVEDPLAGIDLAGFALGNETPAGSEDRGGEAGPAGAVRTRSGTSLDDEPYPAIDLRLPTVPAGGEELLRACAAERARPGTSLAYDVLIAQALRTGYDPDPSEVPPELALAAAVLRAAKASHTHDDAALAQALEDYVEVGGQAVSDIERHTIVTKLARIEGSVLEASGQDTVEQAQERLERALAASEQVVLLAEARLAGPVSQAELVDIFDCADGAAIALAQMERPEDAQRLVEIARKVAPRIEHLRARGEASLADQVRATEAFVAVASFRVYEACRIAEELLRGNDPTPLNLAESARWILMFASVQVGEGEEALIQARELVNMNLSVGLGIFAAFYFEVLARTLNGLGRPLEAAEVLETALAGEVPPAMEARLREAHISILAALDEDAGVRDACLEAAEMEIAQGQTDKAIGHLTQAAGACQAVDENVRAAHLFARAAELTGQEDDWSRINQARLLRRSARATVDEMTIQLARARLDDARALMARSRQILEQVPAFGAYSPVYEMADWQEDMAWVLWRTDENHEAIEHCEQAAEGFLRAHQRDDAARALTLQVQAWRDLGEVASARATIARVREVLSHRRWEGHPALEAMDRLEAQLDEAEED